MKWLARNKVFAHLFLLIVSPFALFAQEDLDFEQFMQDIIPFDEERVENLDYYDQLLQIYQNPINLNKADRKDLEQLYILSHSQINQLIKYKNHYGDFLSIYELQAIPEFDLITINRLKYFVEVKNRNTDNRTLKERLKEPDQSYLMVRFQRQLEKTEGFNFSDGGNNYLGDPNQYLIRFRKARYGDYSFGFTMEKDAGEEIIWNSSKKQFGFDFLSGHLYREEFAFTDKFILGDYQLQYGQGLIFSSGFGTGKSAQTILSTKRVSSGISPYSSAMESGFQRGIAIDIPINNFNISSFFSGKAIDANIINDDSTDSGYIKSIATTGLHNTPGYMKRRKASSEKLFGLNLNWKDKTSSMGLTFAQQSFSAKISRKDQLRSNYQFIGTKNRNIGINYDFNILNANFFGEIAFSNSGGGAIVSGLIKALNPRTDISLHFRHFDKNYNSIRGAVFSEGTSPINETGFYFGLSKAISKSWTFNAYYDLFRFPWLTYLSKSPSKGNETLLRLSKQISRKSNFYLQFKNEQKELSYNEGTSPILYLRDKREWIFQLHQAVNDIISFRTRLQSTNILSKKNSKGVAITQDLRLEYRKLRFDFRTAIFNTSDYQSRIYVLEREVLYSLSAPAYFGNGIRNYILIKYNASKKFDFWIKWARTLRTDVDFLGSGLNKSHGNSRNTIKLQLKVNL